MSLAIYSQSDSGSSQFSSEVNSGHVDEHTHDYHIYNYDIEDGEVLHEYFMSTVTVMGKRAMV